MTCIIMNKMKCLVCHEFESSDGKKLSNHLKSKHNLPSLEYTVKFLYDGQKPSCLECNSETRYVSFSFKEYCKHHAGLAMKNGGKKGGKASSWNKGLTKETDERILKQSEEMKGDNNPFFGKRHTDETVRILSESKKLSKEEILRRFKEYSDNHFEPLNIEEYTNRQDYLRVKCKRCGLEDLKKLEAIERGSPCKKCEPASRSVAEEQIASFIESLGFSVKRNDRKKIAPKEIDILIESKGLGIDYDGLYWHSTSVLNDKESKYIPYEKWKLSRDNKISLIRFYSDEWMDKKQIVESLIRHRLGISEKIGARETYTCEISSQEGRKFLNENHLDGATRSKKYFALKEKKSNELVAVLSVREPFHSSHRKEKRLEIARFSSKKNLTVVGGLSKIMKLILSWAKENGYKSIMTYSDLRIGYGNGYRKIGMTEIGHTGPSYWYTDGKQRIDRFAIRAQNGMSEREIAASLKLEQIWSPGNLLFEMKL